ncbi:MAG: SPOR domain-containing protein, partial [Alphaproteobacteria bacterium]|nr:SPOR domain-containing protein [Alphaproteobacteria bacterium]
PPADAAVAARPAEPPAAIASAQTAGPVRVQLLAGRTEEMVRREWARAQADNPDIFGRLRVDVVRIDLGPERGSFYRLYTGPLADVGSADRLCRQARERRVECFVVKP